MSAVAGNSSGVELDPEIDRRKRRLFGSGKGFPPNRGPTGGWSRVGTPRAEESKLSPIVNPVYRQQCLL